jgi:predicted nucleotidyltransferase
MDMHTTREVLQNLPDDKRQIVEEIVAAVSGLAGVQAIVLAGSYARGTARPDSDVDLGIYYREQAPFSVGKLRQAVEHFDVTGSPTVTDFYEWGPWVNLAFALNRQGPRLIGLRAGFALRKPRPQIKGRPN